jgi:hypothetical protein
MINIKNLGKIALREEMAWTITDNTPRKVAF